MVEDHRESSIHQVPSSLEAQAVVEESRRLFNRTLAAWASDVLTLRKSGLRHPSWPAGFDQTGLPRAA